MLELELPVAPTSNNAFFNRQFGRGFGRGKTKKYREWLRQADKHYVLQGLGRKNQITGQYKCEMTFPDRTGDLDGRIKLVLDWLVSRQLVPDDSSKYLRKLNTEFADTGGLVWIKLEPIQGEASTSSPSAPRISTKPLRSRPRRS